MSVLVALVVPGDDDRLAILAIDRDSVASQSSTDCVSIRHVFTCWVWRVVCGSLPRDDLIIHIVGIATIKK